MYSITGTTVRHKRGDTFISKVEILDNEEHAYTPAVSDVITYTLKKTRWDTTPKVTKTLDNETMLLQLDPADTVTLPDGRYVYYVDIVQQGGAKDTFISGVWILEA